jgi:hypothetical protein
MSAPFAEIARTELLTKCPTNPRWEHCLLQDAFLAAGLSGKYEVKTAVTDAAD